MIILITNDDGIVAPGIRAMYEALDGLGERWVVAPSHERSGVGHGFSQRGPLKVMPVDWDGTGRQFAVAGTPADAVKLAFWSLLPDKPALIVSGINSGENTGVDMLYSGTLGGAREGAVLGVPAVAVSRSMKAYPNFNAARHFARLVCSEVLDKGLPQGIALNVNVPAGELSQMRGIMVTRQTPSYYREVVSQVQTLEGLECDWVEYQKIIRENLPDGDVVAVREGWVSVTPVHHRLTEESILDQLKGWRMIQAADRGGVLHHPDGDGRKESSVFNKSDIPNKSVANR